MQALGKILYAFLFLVLLPAGLWYWAVLTEPLISFPAIESKFVGLLFVVVGLCLLLWGMFALRKYGKGLPMNSFPPSEFVAKGPYRLFRHPIYWGFGFLVVGVAVMAGSASGLWLVAPITILGMIGLVWGYEKIDLEERFPGVVHRTVFDFPEDNLGLATGWDRLVSLFWVGGLLLLGNYLLLFLFGSPAFNPKVGPPVLGMIVLIVVMAVPFFIKRKNDLLSWTISAILGLVLSDVSAMMVPRVFAQYFSVGYSSPGAVWVLLRVLTSVPIFMVFIGYRSVVLESRRYFLLFGTLAIVLSLVLLMNSQSAILHLITSLVIYLLASYYGGIWMFLRNTSERIGNSWREWVFGKVRVINHGFYIGFGAFLGILLAGYLSGPLYAWAILVFAVIVIVFSALWAQIIEGSEKLKRPFGYYGALVGIPFASLAVWGIGVQVWVIIGVVSVVMPWVQAIGRLRCLVNGCCHGRPVDNPNIGIRFFHIRSRVTNISGLKGRLLHPTQLYSMLWLLLVGFVLLTVWGHHFSASFVFGLYLIMTGLGRFVEEAYRGETQTPIVWGLRLYQWTAVLSVVLGIVMTVVPSDPVQLAPGLGWETVVAAAVGGVFTFFAMGVDFPYSNVRFSRLV
jgi:prolipoprotein diacylglyceryltransferase/protein-S-isoprenylcysteine O-methyltransferase Ste14